MTALRGTGHLETAPTLADPSGTPRDAAAGGAPLRTSSGGTARRPPLLGLAAAAGCAVLAAYLFLPDWSIGDAARRFCALCQKRPWLYWGLGYAALVALVGQTALAYVLAGAPRRASFWTSRTLFVLLTVAAVVLLRLPGLAPQELDPDESEDLALALTLREDPRYWVSADGGTHGPLVEFALLPVRLVGLRLDFAAARLVVVCLTLGGTFFVFGTLRAFFPEALSRVAVVPLVLCSALLTAPGFIVFNAEQPPVFLLCAAGYGCARLAAGPAAGVRWRALATGAVLGLVPFAKLQAAPVGVALALVALVCLLGRLRGRGREQLAASLCLCAGGLAPAVGVACYLWYQGVFAYFWSSYVGTNFSYAARRDLGTFARLGYFLEWAPKWFPDLFLPFFACLICTGLLLIGLLRLGRGRGVATNWRLLLPGAAVLAVSVYAISASGYDFEDYLIFLLFPVAYLAAVVVATLHEALPNRATRLGLVAVCLTAVVAVPSARAWEKGNRWLRSAHDRPDPVVRLVRRYAAPGDRLVVWGWGDHYYVRTGMRPATRESTYRTIQWKATGTERGELFYRLFLEEFDRTRPPLVVAAVGDWASEFLDPDEWSLENYPEVRERVAARYVMVGRENGARVYVSKERLARRPRAPGRSGDGLSR